MRARFVLVLAFVLCLGLGATAVGSAHAREPSPIHTAFVKLRSNLRHADGLRPRTRAKLLRRAWRAERQRSARHRPCPALASLEELRRAIRRSAAPHVRGVYAVEVAILRTRPGSRCGHLSKRVTIVPMFQGGGPIEPLPRVGETPEEDEGVPGRRVTSGIDMPEPGPATDITPVAPGESHATGPDPFRFSTLTDIRTPVFAVPEEPTQAAAGRVVWYTGNSGAAFSLDGGKTFEKVDPRLIVPEGDTPFCCDQVVVYAPQINRFIWFIQYWCSSPDGDCFESGKQNAVRVLVASPQDIVEHRDDMANAWMAWTIQPSDLGVRRDWLDYPDLGLGANSLYITSNMFQKGHFAQSVVARVSLADLKAGGPLQVRYSLDPNEGSYKVVQGAGTRGFLATQHSATELLTLSWDERSPLLLRHWTRHSLSASHDYESMTDFLDWGFRTDDRITGGTRRGNELWLAWSEGREICTDRCRPFWPQPHVHVVVVDSRTFRVRRERFIHNPDFAIAYPSLATDSLGRVGLSFSYGGGTAGNASPAAGYLTGGEVFRQVATSPAPGHQGDYFSLRPDWPDASRLTGTGYVTDDSRDVHWLFYRYSRPPAGSG